LVGKPLEITAAAEFQEHDDGDGSVARREGGDGLWLPVFQYPEIVTLQARDQVPVLRRGHDVQRDNGNFHGNGHPALLRLLLRACRRRRWRLLLSAALLAGGSLRLCALL